MQALECHAGSDHREKIDYLSRIFRQAIESSDHGIPNGRGQLKRIDLPAEPLLVAFLWRLMPLRVDDFPFQHARLDQRLERLFHKKRIAACPSIEQGRERADCSQINPERCME